MGRYGPDSREAGWIRAKHQYLLGFADLADALDRIKQRLGGSGIDWKADEKP